MTPARWREAVGTLIEDARNGESIRACAKRAGVDEAMWRQVERGSRPAGDGAVTANPRDRNLEAIALAVGLDPADVFAAAGRTYTPSRRNDRADRLAVVEERLDRIEATLDRLLDDEPAP